MGLLTEPLSLAGEFVDPANDEIFGSYEFKLFQSDEIAWSEELQRLGIEGLRENPAYVFDVLGRNALGYLELTPSENEFAEFLDGRNLDFRRATLPLFYVVTAVGWFGLIVRRRTPEVLLLIGVGLSFMGSSLFFVSPPRLRAPFDLICCLGVGLAFAWWADRREPRRTTSPTPSGEVRAPARP